MSVIDPDSPDFDDYPWDPRYDGGPGDLYDLSPHAGATVYDPGTPGHVTGPAANPEGH